jgi:hypothetical protein
MKILPILFIVSSLVFAIACSPIYGVQYDYDTKTDFASLKSYDWLPLPAEQKIDELNEQRIRKAMDMQLQAKGLTMTSETPDFLIAIHLGKKDKVQVTDWGYGYGPGGSYWGGYSGYGGGLDVYQYEEGTLIVDFVDPVSMNLIWRGSAKSEVGTEKTPQEREQKTTEAVQKILEKFPPPPEK